MVKSGTLLSAAQYLRMSTDHQMYSLENQEAVIRAFALAHDYQLVATYQDAGRSGVTIKARDGLKSLLADVLAGSAPFQAVLVLDVSRWGRFQDPDEAAHYEFLCRNAGVDVVYCAEPFENSVTGAIFKQIKRVMAGEYSRELSEKCRRGRWRQALNGVALGGATPFGFRRQVFFRDGTPGPILAAGERKPRLDSEVRYVWGPRSERTTLRQIFADYVFRGKSAIQIARNLNASGRPWKDGLQWTEIRVGKVLKCEMVIGNQVFGKSYTLLGSIQRPTPEATWVRRRIARPIVSVELYRAAQARCADLVGRRFKTDAEMLEDLRQILKAEGRLSARIINLTPHALKAGCYYHRFGSLSAAYRAAGIEPPWPKPMVNSRRPLLTRDEILRALMTVYVEQGRITHRLIQIDHRLPSLHSIKKNFVGLSDACHAANIPYPGPRAPIPLKI